MAENKEEKEEKKQEQEKPNLPKELEKIESDKIRGHIIIFDPKNSEFSKNLELNKQGDYTQKKK